MIRHSSMEVLNEIMESCGDMDEIKRKLEELANVLQEDKVLMDDMKVKYKRLEIENEDLVRSIEQMKTCVETDDKEREDDALIDEFRKTLHNERNTAKYFSLQELRSENESRWSHYITKGTDTIRSDTWDAKLPQSLYSRLNSMGLQFDKKKGSKNHSMHKIDSMSSIDKIREEIRKERAKCRSIVDDSMITIEKIKAKLELERLKNRRIIERKIKRIAELERRVDESLNEAQEMKFENERNKDELRRCRDELNKLKNQKHVNKDDYMKYKKFYLDRFVAYNWIILDLTNLEKLLPAKRLCFPRYKVERNIIRRVKKLLSDGMAIT